MLKKEFRCYTRKNNRKCTEPASKILKKSLHHENLKDYEGLSYCDIQNITRAIMRDPKAMRDPNAHQNNMGVLQTIKGRIYCLKLGEVSKSKNVEHFFYCNQYKRMQQKVQPLKKLSSNETYKATIERF